MSRTLSRPVPSTTGRADLPARPPLLTNAAWRCAGLHVLAGLEVGIRRRQRVEGLDERRQQGASVRRNEAEDGERHEQRAQLSERGDDAGDTALAGPRR